MNRVRDLLANTHAQINKLTQLDERPFTMNEHYFDSMRDKLLAHLKDRRFPKPAGARGVDADDTTTTAAAAAAQHADQVKQALASLALLGHNVKAEDLAKLRPADEYETELAVMAETRAYWHIAYKVSRRGRRISTTQSRKTAPARTLDRLSLLTLPSAPSTLSPLQSTTSSSSPQAVQSTPRSWPSWGFLMAAAAAAAGRGGARRSWPSPPCARASAKSCASVSAGSRWPRRRSGGLGRACERGMRSAHEECTHLDGGSACVGAGLESTLGREGDEAAARKGG